MISENRDSAARRTRGRPRTRVEVGDVPRLHLPSLLADGRAIPGQVVRSTLAVPGPDGAEMVLSIVAELKARHGQVLVFRPGGSCYAVQVTSDPQPFGGRRWWFMCPALQIAVATLYLPPGAERFASRQAHRLGYRSQRLSAQARAAERGAAA